MHDFLERLLAGDQNAIIKVALAYFVFVGGYGTLTTYRMSRWPSVVGRLHELGVTAGVPSLLRDDQNFSGHARYTYTVDGTSYENDCLSPFYLTATRNLRFLIRWQLRFVDRVGLDGVRVYYNPKNPRKSHLVRVGVRSVALVSVMVGSSATLILFAVI